jgi:DNA polymerase III subunit chi
MTEVAFHLNVADIGDYTCRLLRKAYLKGARVQVLADAALIERLDRDLWLLGQGEFVPHATGASPVRVRQRSPIVLGDAPAEAVNVLVNLAPQLPEGAGAFARVIDIVGSGEVERQQARQRWKLYRDAGLDPVAIDLAGAREG